MKNLSLLIILSLLTLPCIAQVDVPSGMRYQAIARDQDGIIRSGENLSVKAELLLLGTTDEVVYAEEHETTSGEFGLLNITIGEGKNIRGSFKEVPWSSHLWVRISIKNDKENNYQLITTSKLYSVPYAYYAASAGKLAEETGENGNNGRAPNIGMNSINWTLEGNYNSQNRNGGHPVLGTTDENDLVIVTTNQTRMVISKEGPIEFMGDIDMNGNLNVDGNTTLQGTLEVKNMSATHLSGTLTVDKATTLNDDLSVENMSPTHLTGVLDVDKTLNVDGATTLNNSLTVTNESPTSLTGPLEVNKETTLHDDLTVTNMASTHLTGTLEVDKTLNVDGATTLNNTLDVTNQSATHLTGSLTVDKETKLNDDLSVENAASTHLTGPLDVEETLNVDGPTTLNNTLHVTGNHPTTLTGTLTVDKTTTLNDDLTVENAAPTYLTGSLDVDGAFNSNGQITVDGALIVSGMNPSHLTGTLEVDKLATLESGLKVSGQGTLGPNGDHVAFFDNTEGGQSDGIAIRINNANTNAQNNFVTFYKGNDGVAGRIEGYVLNDVLSPPIPESDEIWSAICVALADYNPVTLFWTQFATYFNAFGTVWNGATIPGFALPDFPGLELPDFPGLTTPNFPGLGLPDYPGLVLPNFDGVSIPDIPSVSLDGVGEVFPGLVLPDIPGVNIPDIPGFTVPDIPAFNVADIPSFTIPNIPAFTIPDVPAIDLANDLFEMPTIPTFSDILVDQGVCPDVNIFEVPDGYVYRLIEWGVQNDMQNMISFSPVDLAAKVLTWGVTKVVKAGGVTYGSKGADYAEYLPKLHPTEQFMGGEIVGVHGGKISKITRGADQILAISTKPLVLGNQPDESEADVFAKVGFLGQVPVFVEGPVQLGDYIIPSGKNDGIGKAIRPSEINAEVLPMIFGKAWSDSELETTVLINVSIGLRPNEIAEVLQQREQNLLHLQQQLDQQQATHESLRADINLLKSYFESDAKSSDRP